MPLLPGVQWRLGPGARTFEHSGRGRTTARLAPQERVSKAERPLVDPSRRAMIAHGIRAPVAELVDAPDSKSGGGNTVLVRARPGAPNNGRSRSQEHDQRKWKPVSRRIMLSPFESARDLAPNRNPLGRIARGGHAFNVMSVS